MTYAVVCDIPATWETYEPLGRALVNPVPTGLLLHVAGPTDEGYRVIDVWATREDWERFRAVRDEIVGAATLGPVALRELNGVATVRGADDIDEPDGLDRRTR
jgi:hypothetical protein